ncbi:MAG: hypothetical protein ACOX3R_11855 [Desulfitobacteriia bacterium]|jgi:hypothetical protein
MKTYLAQFVIVGKSIGQLTIAWKVETEKDALGRISSKYICNW